ncbi:MAG: monovalent cation/H+ antiporter subunit D [Gammaproteobacteria bacterium]
MNHWLIAPVLLPLACGAVLMTFGRHSLPLQRALSVAATVALLPIAAGLLIAAGDGDYRVYALGGWPPPFGIVLVLDRLSALLLLLTAVVAACSLLHALRGTDAAGSNFHALFQFQLMGLNGAFLTGDLFNLFVFFEVLLLASYGLLLHGGDAARIRAGFHYVVLNLVGSTLFLVAVGILYGVLGTLNMADLAQKIATATVADAALLRAGGLLLLVVFGLKAALLPLYFWLPGAYGATSAPVAALFAIMTKVGVYAIIRVFTLIFGPQAGPAADVAAPWLLPLALATLAAGALGALASDNLRTLVAYLIVLSVGMLLTAVGLFSASGLSAALYYLPHTTLITAGLFLLADIIATRRGHDRLQAGLALDRPLVPGALFFIGAVAIVGLPPFSGFVGKLVILQAARGDPAIAWIWATVLTASLLSLIALAQAGSTLFWKAAAPAAGEPARAQTHRNGLSATVPAAALLSFGALLVAFGGPITALTGATAQQLVDPLNYIEGVLGDDAGLPATGGASP